MATTSLLTTAAPAPSIFGADEATAALEVAMARASEAHAEANRMSERYYRRQTSANRKAMEAAQSAEKATAHAAGVAALATEAGRKAHASLACRRQLWQDAAETEHAAQKEREAVEEQLAKLRDGTFSDNRPMSARFEAARSCLRRLVEATEAEMLAREATEAHEADKNAAHREWELVAGKYTPWYGLEEVAN